MNLFARLAQDLWKQERVGCRELGGYRSHEFDHHLYDYPTPPYCRFCGTKLYKFSEDTLRFGTRVKPRWSIRVLGWLGGLEKYWWKRIV